MAGEGIRGTSAEAGRAGGYPEGRGATRLRGPSKPRPLSLTAQDLRLPTEARPPIPELGVLPSVVTALWALSRQGLRLPQPRPRPSLPRFSVPPSSSLPFPLPPSLPPSLPQPPAALQRSGRHPWAHKVQYLKDARNFFWFLWQRENKSHFPAKLKENTFFFALWVANYF